MPRVRRKDLRSQSRPRKDAAIVAS